MPAGVRDAAHQPVHRIDLADQMALAETADGGVAGHLADGRNPVCDERGAGARAGRRRGRLAARMAAADHDYVELARHPQNLPENAREKSACARRNGFDRRLPRGLGACALRVKNFSTESDQDSTELRIPVQAFEAGSDSAKLFMFHVKQIPVSLPTLPSGRGRKNERSEVFRGGGRGDACSSRAA